MLLLFIAYLGGVAAILWVFLDEHGSATSPLPLPPLVPVQNI